MQRRDFWSPRRRAKRMFRLKLQNVVERSCARGVEEQMKPVHWFRRGGFMWTLFWSGISRQEATSRIDGNGSVWQNDSAVVFVCEVHTLEGLERLQDEDCHPLPLFPAGESAAGGRRVCGAGRSRLICRKLERGARLWDASAADFRGNQSTFSVSTVGAHSSTHLGAERTFFRVRWVTDQGETSTLVPQIKEKWGFWSVTTTERIVEQSFPRIAVICSGTRVNLAVSLTSDR